MPGTVLRTWHDFFLNRKRATTVMNIPDFYVRKLSQKGSLTYPGQYTKRPGVS